MFRPFRPEQPTIEKKGEASRILAETDPKFIKEQVTKLEKRGLTPEAKKDIPTFLAVTAYAKWDRGDKEAKNLVEKLYSE